MGLTQEIVELMEKKALDMIKNSLFTSPFMNKEMTIVDLRAVDDWTADLAISIIEASNAVNRAMDMTGIDKNTSIKVKYNNLDVGNPLAINLSLDGGEKINSAMAMSYFGGPIDVNGKEVVVSANIRWDEDIINDAAIKFSDRLKNDMIENDRDIKRLIKKEEDKNK